jgi:RNA polymerase sigma-54 factor
MPVTDLETYISQQLLENCLLEQEEIGVEETFEECECVEPLPLNYLETNEVPVNDDPIENDYLFNENPVTESQRRGDDAAKTVYDNLEAKVPTLQEHLISQLHLTPRTVNENLIAEFLIGNIDADGYLQCEFADVTKIFETSNQEVEKLVQLIQTFEPVGIGARNLQECLLLQLEFQKEYLLRFKCKKDRLELARTIVEDHIYDIAEAKLHKMTTQLKCSISEIQAAIDIIKTLNPKPGRNYGVLNDTRFIIPDVTIRLLDNEYLIMINESANTRLFISPLYRQLIQNRSGTDEDVMKYLKEKQNAALNLMRSIAERKTTLYQITKAIIEIQCKFLEKGPLYLKPLTLHQVAELVGLHESTVSRAIADKYMDCPRGIFPFKYFFNASLDSDSGDTISAASVKTQIKTAIDQEDPKAPISDQQLIEILTAKGIAISRRTITKYREELKIPASTKRRRY